MTRRCDHCDCPQADADAENCSLCGEALPSRGRRPEATGVINPAMAGQKYGVSSRYRVARLALILGGMFLAFYLLNRLSQFVLSPNRTAIKAVEECVGLPVPADSTGRLSVGMRIADLPMAIGYSGDMSVEGMSALPNSGRGRFTAAWRNGRVLALLLQNGRVTEVREGKWGARDGFLEWGYTDGFSNWKSSVIGEWKPSSGPPRPGGR